MNFSIHIDESLNRDLEKLVKKQGRTRNALINEALKYYIESQARTQWPPLVLELAGADKDMVPFEKTREELKSPSEDPLA